jgi:Saxitoxin biosynthesis operon protein SxtJ
MDNAARRELRQFGLLTGSLIAVLFGGLIPWLRGRPYPAWPWVVGIVLVSAGAIYPASLKYPFAIWSAVGKILGWINSRVVLGLLFYVAVTPIGFVMKLTGRDTMARKFNSDAQTYRVTSRRASIQSLERPF